MFGRQAPKTGRARAAAICHVLRAGSGNTDQDRAGGSNQWAVCVLHRSLHFWVEYLADKRGLLGLYKVINDLRVSEHPGSCLKLKQLPNKTQLFSGHLMNTFSME